MGTLEPLDIVVMAIYGAIVLGIGWYANRRQKNSEDYFLGGRRLRWWVVGVSLVATSFSSVSLIGGTAFGFKYGLGWLQLQIGDLLALVAVMFVFLLFRHEFDDVLDGILYGALVGLGFATVENVIYYFDAGFHGGIGKLAFTGRPG